MKKVVFILINLTIILVMLFISELVLNIKEYTIGHNIRPYKILQNPYRSEFLHIMHDYYLDIENAFETRKPFIIKNTPVTLFTGCSFTYGMHLEENKTPHVIFSRYSKESSYNWGRPATSPREILSNFRYNIYELPQNNNVKYVIYTYIKDHKRRLYDDMCKYEYDFKEKNNKLIKRNFIPFIEQLKITRAIKQWRYYNIDKGDCSVKVQNLFSLYIKEIYDEISKKYSFYNKPVKFIILIYDEDECDINWQNEISKYSSNIKIIKIKDLLKFDYTQKEWLLEDLSHPNEKFWDVLLPILYKNLTGKK